MKRLLGTLALAPLAITACSDAAKAPTSIEIPTETDAKKQVVVELNRATIGLKANDLTKIDELCTKYFDASFSKNLQDCKGYFTTTLKAIEHVGVETGLKFWEFQELTGNDTAGWSVPVKTKTEFKITNQAKFDNFIDEMVAISQGTETRESIVKSFTDDFKRGLDNPTLNTYELIKSGDTYKIKSWAEVTEIVELKDA